MSACPEWKPKMWHNRYCELNNLTGDWCNDCIHAKYKEPTQAETEEIAALNNNNKTEKAKP